MIVPMRKVHVAARRSDHDALLGSLESLGVVHLVPVDAKAAVADEQTTTAIQHAERALQILASHHPCGEPSQMDAPTAVEEVLRVHRQTSDRQSRLGLLHRQILELAIWGDVRTEQFQALTEAGLDVKIVTVPAKELDDIQAELVHPLGEPHGGHVLAAVVSRGGELELPESAEVHELPARDRPSLKAEAAELHEAIQEDTKELGRLVHLTRAVEDYLAELRRRADYTVASRGSLSSEGITALQGWAPADKADTLADDLAAAGIDSAIEVRKPDEDETPPTLISYPRWVRPIRGLFDIMGTVTGYKEFDVSIPFMLALPVFAAMLIGDGGYGLVILLGLGLFYKKLAPKLGREFVQLLIIIGGTTFIWGLLNGSFLGFSIIKSPLIPVNMTDESRRLLMKISFFMGAIHLSLAQLWQAVRLFPSPRFLGKVGWAIFIWGMLGVVLWLVVGIDTMEAGSPYLYFLIIGAAMAILFAHPSRNPLKWLGLGLASFPLSGISAFSDVTSYVRLMAVGLASGVLASSFNSMAMEIRILPLTILIMILGHGLNLALCLIALFAHGVRLNMLEFSNNLGMQWTGYAYKPFNHRRRCEQ